MAETNQRAISSEGEEQPKQNKKKGRSGLAVGEVRKNIERARLEKTD